MNYEFFQDFIDAVTAETLPTSAEKITFPGGWSGITSKMYDNQISPVQVLGRTLQFQLQTGVPILSRKDMIAEGICRRPPVMGLDCIEPGRVYSLQFLADQIRVIVTGFFDFLDNRGNYPDYIERQRAEIPHFGLMFLERQPGPGVNDSDVAMRVKTLALERGYPFTQGANRDKGVDHLLFELWGKLIEQRFPYYK